MTSLASFSFERPAWLAALVLVAAAAFVRARRPHPVAPLAALRAVDPAGTLPRSLRSRLVALPSLLQGLGLAAAVVAFAGPRTSDAAILPAAGIDIVIGLDLSSSMRARDLGDQRSRLDVARDAARRFVAARPRDRVGIVTFARFADLVAPPTTDHEALVAWLDGIAPVAADGPEDATGIGTALARMVDALRTGAPRGDRVAVLLTDGEENVARAGVSGAIEPLHAAQWARSMGVRLFVVQIGPGSRDAGAATTWAHAVAATGGAVHAATDVSGLDDAWQAIDDLAPTTRDRVVERLRPRHAWAIALAIALVGLGASLRIRALRVAP